MALKLNERYPARFNNPTSQYPQGSFKNRTSPAAKDGSYLEKDWANDKEGFFQSIISEAGLVPNGLVDEVGSSQYFNALMSIISSQSKDNLDTTRIDVASASTINLTTSAPNTRHINITGALVVNGFTIAAGMCYFVRFSGSLTLTNGAALITQTGGNIITAAGDSCIIRAISANVVEILCYTPGIPQELGYRQSRQNLTASRTSGTTYTNSTGRTIAIFIDVQGSNSTETVTLTIGGVVVYSGDAGIGSLGTSTLLTSPVMSGETYSITVPGTSTIRNWTEIR